MILRMLREGKLSVEQADQLLSALGAEDPGSWIPITVARRDDERDLRIRLSERPENLRFRTFEVNTKQDLEDLPTTWGGYDKLPIRSKRSSR